MKTALSEIRSEIDRLDAELVPLLARRLEIADRVAAAKRAEGRGIDDPDREERILAEITARVPSDCADGIRAVYRTLFNESKSRQRGIRVKCGDAESSPRRKEDGFLHFDAVGTPRLHLRSDPTNETKPHPRDAAICN